MVGLPSSSTVIAGTSLVNSDLAVSIILVAVDATACEIALAVVAAKEASESVGHRLT